MALYCGALALVELLCSSWIGAAAEVPESVGCLVGLFGNERYAAGTLVEGNCGFDFSLGLPADAPNCPRTLPIALVLVPKCASVSFLNWIARLDGTTQRWVELVDWFEATAHAQCIFMTGCPHPMAPAEHLVNSIKLISMLNNGEVPRGTDTEITTPEGMAEVYVRFGRWVREGILPYPQDCVTCCTGEGRVPVVVLRNPFARLMAYFQRAWTGEGPASMDAFFLWTEALQAVHDANAYSDALQKGEGVSVSVRGKAFTFDVQDLYHTRPAWHLLTSLFPSQASEDLGTTCRPAECWLRRRIFVVHTESIAHDLELLKVRLCLEYGHCKSVPSVLHLNKRSASQQDDARAFWHSQQGLLVMQRLHAMYREDFVLGSYGANASDMAPSSILQEASHTKHSDTAVDKHLNAVARVEGSAVRRPVR